MITIDTSTFLAKADALKLAAITAYRTMGVGTPGSTHKSVADLIKDPHVDLGLIPTVLPALKEFKSALSQLLNYLQREDVPNQVKSALAANKPEWQAFVDFHKTMNDAIQDGPDGNQKAINLVRDVSTPRVASNVMNAMVGDMSLEPSAAALRDSLRRWVTGSATMAVRRVFASSDVVAALDKLATSLEAKGMAHLAIELDSVSNALEAMD